MVWVVSQLIGTCTQYNYFLVQIQFVFFKESLLVTAAFPDVIDRHKSNLRLLKFCRL